MEKIVFVALSNRIASREARAVNLTNISFIDRLDSGLVYAVRGTIARRNRFSESGVLSMVC